MTDKNESWGEGRTSTEVDQAGGVGVPAPSQPTCWARCSLGEYVFLKNGFAFKSKHYVSPGPNTVPVIRISDIDGKYASDKNASHVDESEVVDGFEVRKGDLLIAMSGATTGKVGVYVGNEPSYQNQRVGNIKLYSHALGNESFRNHLIAYLSPSFLKSAYGGAQPNISGSAIESVRISLPPLPEQKQIAATLDQLLARVEAIKTRLDAIPALLKRFRQSVLAAAVSGRLTEEWRSTSRLVALDLDDLVKSRMKSWKLAGKKKYKAHIESDGTKLPHASWVGCSLDLVAEIKHGFAFRSENFSDHGPIVLTPGNFIEDGELDFVNKRVVRHNEDYADEWLLNKNDLLVVMTDLSNKKLILGKAVLLNTNEMVLHNQRIGKVVPYSSVVSREYIKLSINSPSFKKRIDDTSSGTLIQHTSPTKILSIGVGIPSTKEQTQIVHRVEQLFAFAEQVEQRLAAARGRVDHLAQSILAKAFRGELTAQWRADHPELISGEHSARALLDRIKAERAAAPVKKRSRKKRQ